MYLKIMSGWVSGLIKETKKTPKTFFFFFFNILAICLSEEIKDQLVSYHLHSIRILIRSSLNIQICYNYCYNVETVC